VPDAGWQVAAVGVGLIHLAVVLAVVAGGFVARRRRALVRAQLALVAAVVAVAVAGAPCPLTELELALRAAGGVDPYRGGFIEHYLVEPVHPAGLTARVQVLLHAVAVAANLVAYRGLLLGRVRRPAPEAPA
jgi:hypothetical protein